MNTTDRDAYWDNVKFALICLIVIGHFSNSIKGHSAFCSVLSFFIYTFHIAGFVLIAGMFHNNRNVKGKTLGYLVLYLLIKIANQIPYLIVDHSFHNFDLLRDKSTPWFVFAMSAFICITYLCRNFDPVKVLCVGCCRLRDRLSGRCRQHSLCSENNCFLSILLCGDNAGSREIKRMSEKTVLHTGIVRCSGGMVDGFCRRQDEVYESNVLGHRYIQ